MVSIGTKDDIDSWMELVESISPNFPGLETDELIAEHRNIVLRFMERGIALCVKDGERVVGVILLSVESNMICFLAVSSEYRRKGVASELLTAALNNLDRTKAITVSTFREEDERGKAPRALYKKFGFTPIEPIIDFESPDQVFILKP